MGQGGGKGAGRTEGAALAFLFFRDAFAARQRPAYVELVGGVDGSGGVVQFLDVGDGVRAAEGEEVEGGAVDDDVRAVD